jgi:hypothetical protein
MSSFNLLPDLASPAQKKFALASLNKTANNNN